jgi:hypothetical protein
MSIYQSPLKQTTLTFVTITSDIIYLFRDCIVCIDKILPGECVHRKFSLTDCTTRMIRGYQKEAEKSNRKKSSLDSWIRRMILQRIRKSLPWKLNRETIRLTLMMSPRKRLHFNLNLTKNRQVKRWNAMFPVNLTCRWLTSARTGCQLI